MRPLRRIQAVRTHAARGLGEWIAAGRVLRIRARARPAARPSWKEALTRSRGRVDDGTFKCDDPNGASWRVHALIDGLAVQITVHPRVITRKQYTGWVRLTAARELGIEPNLLE